MLDRWACRVAGYALGGFAIAMALANVACECKPYLPPHVPIRVVLLEPYHVGGTYTGAEQLQSNGVSALPSCADVDKLSTTSSIVVVGKDQAHGEGCWLYGSITIDAPVAVTDPASRADGRGFAAAQDLTASVATTLAGCSGVWTYGLTHYGPFGADGGAGANDPFRDPVPGQHPPWVVYRSFVANASCPTIAGVDAAQGQCVDVFAARLERVTP